MKTGLRWKTEIVAILMGVLGCFTFFWPYYFKGELPGDPGDVRLNEYFLEWGWRIGTGTLPEGSSWRSPPFYWPEENVFGYSDLLLSSAPLYGVFRTSWFRDWGWGVHDAYMAWMTVWAFLTAWAARSWISCWGYQGFPAVIAAGLVAFSSYRASVLNHPQLIFLATVFWGMTAFFKAFKGTSPSWKWSGLAVAWGVFQFWQGYYFAWALLFYASIMAVAFLFTEKNFRDRVTQARWWLPWLLWGGLGLLALLPAVSLYWEVAQTLGVRSYNEVDRGLPRLQSWLNPGASHWLYGWMARWKPIRVLSGVGEHALFMGFATAGVTALGLRTFEWKRRKRWLIAAGVVGVLMLAYHHGGSLWWLVYRFFPGATAIRAVSRVTAVGWALWSAPLLAAGWSELLAISNKKKKWLIGALLLFAGIEQQHSIVTFLPQQLDFERKRVRELAQRVRDRHPECRAFYVWVPQRSKLGFYGEDWRYQMDALWLSLEMEWPTANGYSGNQPPRYPQAAVDHEEQLAAEMKRWVTEKGRDPDELCAVKWPE